MKRLSFFCSLISFALILFPAVSCTKQTATVSSSAFGGTHPVISAGQLLIDDWSPISGGYTSSFSIHQDVFAVYVLNQGQWQELSTNPVDYLGGKLWMNRYGYQGVLTYTNDFNQKPARLDSTIIEMKVTG